MPTTQFPVSTPSKTPLSFAQIVTVLSMRDAVLHLDCFAGVGCWSLGFQRAGIIPVAACEIDAWKSEVYRRFFPGVPVYGDIKSVSRDRLDRDGIGDIGIITGSFPCQDLSAANPYGKGIDGERSGLVWELLRLVAEIRPRYLCVENSPRLINRGYDRIASHLENLCYTSRVFIIGADDLGAPHVRKRAWIIANRADANSERKQQSQRTFHQERGRVRNGIAGDAPDAALPRPLPRPSQAGWEKGTRSFDRDTGDAPDAAFAAGPALASRDGADAGKGAARRGLVERGVRAASNPDCDGHRAADQQPRAISEAITALERAVGAAGLEWHGSPGRHLDMAHGLAPGMARRVAAAAGDSILPQIAEIIGRALLAIDPGLRDERPS